MVKRLVGDKFFHAMAHAFVLREPPFSPLLIHYGETFAAFVEEFRRQVIDAEPDTRVSARDILSSRSFRRPDIIADDEL